MKQVSDHVYIDPDSGGCTVGAIKTPRGVVLVDTPHKPTRAMRWREEVKTLGEIRYLITTEYHFDHTFGNAFFPGVILAHKNTKESFWIDSVLGVNLLKNPEVYIEKVDPEGRSWAQGYEAREPEISFDGHLTLSLEGMELELFGMPGHVPSNTAIYVPCDRLLFTSDNVFHEVMPWYHEALPFEWLQTLDYFKQMDVEVVVPGHGEATGPAVFDEMKRIVQEAIEEVQGAINSGMTREETVDRISFIDRQPVPEEYRGFAPVLQRHFVGRIFDEIQKRMSLEGSFDS
jgi:glyoxylase-like metal-dependent hydrolase (beta-lactamase superfamily II)